MSRSSRLSLFLLALLALTTNAAGVAVADETPAAPMAIEFPLRHASLVGPRALVMVECGGAAAASCEGTLVLSGLSGAHKVPFALQRGERRFLAVPLGEEVERGGRARAVARTLQLTGGTVRTSSVLEIG